MTFPDTTHQDHGLIWFWTDGAWSSLDLLSHAAAVETAYAVIVSFDWATYVHDLRATDPRGRQESDQIVAFLLNDAHPEGDVVRAMNTRSYVRWNVSESDDAPPAAMHMLETVAQLQRVFERGLPRLGIERIQMASPGFIAFRGLAAPTRQFRYLLRDAWDQRRHEHGVATAAVDVARQYVTDRAYALGLRVKAIEARATKELALAIELLHRLEERGRLVDVRLSLDIDEPIRRAN